MDNDCYDELAGIFTKEDFEEEQKRILEEAVKMKNSDDLLLESHGVAVYEADKLLVAKESWALFQLLYEYVGGYKSYESFEDMAKTAEMIKFTYDGKLDGISDFEIEKCLAVGTYNRNHGLKMTSIAVNFICFDKEFARAAARKLQRESLKFSWLECSGKAEKFVLEHCGGSQYFIDPETIKTKVYPDRNIIVSNDGIHYSRILTATGRYVEKVACGTINI